MNVLGVVYEFKMNGRVFSFLIPTDCYEFDSIIHFFDDMGNLIPKNEYEEKILFLEDMYGNLTNWI